MRYLSITRHTKVGVALVCLLLGIGCSNTTPVDLAPTEERFVYDSDSPYVETLQRCIVSIATRFSCPLWQLPLLGMAHDQVQLEHVRQRLVVSHRWMGDRFMEVLNALPLSTRNEFLLLFRSVTAIVIAHDIRPSYYTNGFSSINLDAAYLWTTLAEKRTITVEPDFRTDFGRELQFLVLQRYVRDNSYVPSSYSLSALADDSERTLDDIVVPLSRLLFHELAHANDFFPPALHRFIDAANIPRHAVGSAFRVSTFLYGDTDLAVAGLQSNRMLAYARIRYRGEASLLNTDIINTDMDPQVSYGSPVSWDAEMVATDFQLDGATGPYNYTTQYEDAAELFETLMMARHFGAELDVAFVDRPEETSPVCDDYVVQGGTRGRISSEPVKSRARFVAARILPEADFTPTFAALPAWQQMASDCGWCDNEDLACDTTEARGAHRDEATPAPREPFDISPFLLPLD